jgi:hypothetical protein
MPSSHHVVTSFLEQPRAIAIVLGHLGSTDAELRRLSQIYRERHCAVVAARSPPLDFFLTQHGRLRPIASEILRETASLSRQCNNQKNKEENNVPVVIHQFSNGGTFLLEAMTKEEHGARGDSSEDYNEVKKRLQYIFYDSCPCYLHMPWALGPYWNDAFPFPGWRSLPRKLYLLAASVSLSVWCLCTGSLSRSRDFWDSVGDPFNCQHLVYMYTTNDKVTDATRIDDLIDTQRENGKDVLAYKYCDSSHVGLLRDHAEDYNRAVDLALERAIERATSTATSTATTSVDKPT